MRFLRTNTAARVTVGPFFDKTDGVTPETALTVTSCKLTLMVDDGNVPTLVLDTAPTASGGANDMVHVTGDDAGFYDLELAAANVNYLGRAMLAITDAATHCPVFHEFMILPAMVYDSLILGTDDLDTNTKKWNDLTTVALPLVPTTAGRTLDVSAAGNAGIDWSNIEAPTTTVAFTGTTIADTQKVDLNTIKTQAVVCAAGVTMGVYVGQGTAALAVDGSGHVTVGTMAANTVTASALAADAVTEIQSGLSTLTQAQVTGGAYALNSASFAFNAALDFTTTQKAATLARVTLVDTATTTGTATNVTTVNGLAANVITAASIADGAIDTATFAAGTTIPRCTLVDTTTTNTDMITAAGIRTAVGIASANLDTQIGTLATAANLATVAGYLDTEIAAILADTNELQTDWANGGRLDLILDTIAADTTTDIPATIAALPTAAQNAAALMDLSNGIETSITPRQAIRLILAAAAGKLSGAATTAITIRNVGDSKDRITATVDSSGNRTAVTVDGT